MSAIQHDQASGADAADRAHAKAQITTLIQQLAMATGVETDRDGHPVPLAKLIAEPKVIAALSQQADLLERLLEKISEPAPAPAPPTSERALGVDADTDAGQSAEVDTTEADAEPEKVGPSTETENAEAAVNTVPNQQAQKKKAKPAQKGLFGDAISALKLMVDPNRREQEAQARWIEVFETLKGRVEGLEQLGRGYRITKATAVVRQRTKINRAPVYALVAQCFEASASMIESIVLKDKNLKKQLAAGQDIDPVDLGRQLAMAMDRWLRTPVNWEVASAAFEESDPACITNNLNTLCYALPFDPDDISQALKGFDVDRLALTDHLDQCIQQAKSDDCQQVLLGVVLPQMLLRGRISVNMLVRALSQARYKRDQFKITMPLVENILFYFNHQISDEIDTLGDIVRSDPTVRNGSVTNSVDFESYGAFDMVVDGFSEILSTLRSMSELGFENDVYAAHTQLRDYLMSLKIHESQPHVLSGYVMSRAPDVGRGDRPVWQSAGRRVGRRILTVFNLMRHVNGDTAIGPTVRPIAGPYRHPSRVHSPPHIRVAGQATRPPLY